MKLKRIALLFCIVVSTQAFGNAQQITTDSIMKNVMDKAAYYGGFVQTFMADIYMRAYVGTIKKNFLYKYTHFVPHFVLNDPKSDEALLETLGVLKYSHPNHYVHQIKTVTGTLTKRKNIEMLPYDLLNINIYSEASNNEDYFLPLRYRTAKYYKYKLRNSYSDNGKDYFVIDYTPKYEHPKLMNGSFIVESDTWRIVRFDGECIDILGKFILEISMGSDGYKRFLPEDFVIYQMASYLGNEVSYRYLAKIDYNEISLREEPFNQKKQLNLSDYFRIKMDSIPVRNDSVFWKINRPIPLQAKEKEVRDNFLCERTEKIKPDTLSQIQKAGKIASFLMQDFGYEYKLSRIGYAGVLNPSLIGFSSKDGLTFKQRLSFTQDLYHQRMLQVDAFAGYMFKRKELFTDLSMVWNYNPRRLGRVMLSLGNGNATYSTRFRDEVQNAGGEGWIRFDSIPIDYYKDYYFRFLNNIEISNGFQVSGGMEYHIRKGNETSAMLQPFTLSGTQSDIAEMFGTKRYFIPIIKFSWTPEQYHRFEGKQKIYVRSFYPTFQIEYSKSVKDVLGSTSKYDRIEFDVSQYIPVGLMKSFNYRIGYGKFFNQKNEYFSDFAFFAKNNFPDVWENEIGGTFSLLNRYLYNASDSYIQAHLMYETPFIIFNRIPLLSPGVVKEGLYFSQLYTPQIRSYSEFGYGIGNRFFDLAAFVSFHKLEFQEVGLKIAFELK
ncbi:MAG: DUF5686 family protein [Dysgonamonadaceae bacterium]|jgi:hypothetical protein|nr:DUF5686 family protein [Dysgonamonadaceae bacterium]